jgi:hypothetical protein
VDPQRWRGVGAVKDVSRFVAERNLVLWLDEQEMADGAVVRHDTIFWCEASDKDRARYIATALNIHHKEILNGSR